MQPGPELTPEQLEELDKILAEINAVQSVIGSLIVGYDGLLLTSKLPARYDAEFIGLTAVALFKSTEKTVKDLEHKRLHQIVSRTEDGHLTIADFGDGLLVTLTDDTALESNTRVMKQILTQLSERN